MHFAGKEDVLINACCPGWVRTDMAEPNAPPGWALSPEQGAETPVYLALLPPGSPIGKYLKNKAIAKW